MQEKTGPTVTAGFDHYGAAQAAHRVMDNIHSDPATRQLSDLVRGRKSGQQDQLLQFIIG